MHLQSGGLLSALPVRRGPPGEYPSRDRWGSSWRRFPLSPPPGEEPGAADPPAPPDLGPRDLARRRLLPQGSLRHLQQLSGLSGGQDVGVRNRCRDGLAVLLRLGALARKERAG